MKNEVVTRCYLPLYDLPIDAPASMKFPQSEPLGHLHASLIST